MLKHTSNTIFTILSIYPITPWPEVDWLKNKYACFSSCKYMEHKIKWSKTNVYGHASACEWITYDIHTHYSGWTCECSWLYTVIFIFDTTYSHCLKYVFNQAYTFY